MTVVVGTAGHIDHGKTTLLRALTGIDADRLPEEHRRGMTIDVGYAHLALADGDVLDFVDVPGHDRLVGNMLVGAGEIDAVLLVVAADDGPRAQTLEHLELLDALRLVRGVVAVTKTDVVTAERVTAVIDQVRVLVERTTLAGAPILAVSAVTGAGLDGTSGCPGRAAGSGPARRSRRPGASAPVGGPRLRGEGPRDRGHRDAARRPARAQRSTPGGTGRVCRAAARAAGTRDPGGARRTGRAAGGQPCRGGPRRRRARLRADRGPRRGRDGPTPRRAAAVPATGRDAAGRPRAAGRRDAGSSSTSGLRRQRA